MTLDRSTCGDPEGLGAGCERGRWYGPCGDPDCEDCGSGYGMCTFLGPCECRGCDSFRCCSIRARVVVDPAWSGVESSSWMWADFMWVYDREQGRDVRRPIVNGPSI